MLFGHQNDSKQPVINDVTAPHDPAVNPLAIDADTGISLPVAPEELEHDGSADAPVLNQPSSEAANTGAVFSPHPEDVSGTTAATVPAPASADEGTSTSSSHTSDVSDDVLQSGGDDDLIALKQQALQQLSPLVGHLDQSPEEKFRTTMMMIQSSDNQALIKDAYTAAQEISDDKVRAQALLDIVNEINYFTQQAEN